jgi:hypothetical protein
VKLGDFVVVLKDSAVLSGGTNPTGTITFTLIYGGQTVDTETVTVNGNGTYTTPGYTLPTSGTVVGTYQWNASYSGDANNNTVNENGNAAEQVSVSMAAPRLSLVSDSPGNFDSIPDGAILSLSYSLSGGYNPTGTLTFALDSPDVSLQTFCKVDVTVNGNGTYGTAGVCKVDSRNSGNQEWRVTYSGDSNNIIPLPGVKEFVVQN